MIYQYRIAGKKFQMDFEDHEVITGRPGQDLFGYTYVINDREYQDVTSLRKNMVTKLSAHTAVYEDIYGFKILYHHTPIPTFDIYDREWDSAFDEYLIFDDTSIHLVTSKEGYKIARLEVYRNLMEVSPDFETCLKELGLPWDVSKSNKY